MKISINEMIFMALKVSQMSNVPLLLMGNPGCGKTTSVEYYAKTKGMKMILLRGSQSNPEEILGYEVNDGVEVSYGSVKVKKASKICPNWYDDLMQSDKEGVSTLLFLDEITTASSFVQSSLLQVIFGRSIDNGYDLPKSTFVVAAGNYSGNLSVEFNLIPPLMNRFCILNVSIEASDIDVFMSRYQSGKQNICSQLNMFDLNNSIDVDTLDPGFIKNIERLMESKIATQVKGLISNHKFDPNVTDMSDIYQDQSTGSKLPGFLTPRTMCYFVDTSIAMYKLFGSQGVESSVFREMTYGLVGISLSESNSKERSINKNLVVDDFVSLVKNVASQLDKNKISSINQIEISIRKILTRTSSGEGKYVNRLDSTELHSLRKIFDSAIKDKELRKVTTPIESKILSDCSYVLVSTSRSIFNDNKDEIKGVINDKSSGKDVSLDLESINGDIKTYNDVVNCYRSLSTFVKVSEFKYQKDCIDGICVTDGDVLRKNRFRVDQLKSQLKSTFGLLGSDLMETEKL